MSFSPPDVLVVASVQKALYNYGVGVSLFCSEAGPGFPPCFRRKKDVFSVKDEDLFFKLVSDSFKQKRKTLRNNLKGYDLSIIEFVLDKYGYDLSVRAENVSIDIFVEISNNLTK